ncbi:5-formyltetrahydrofolate cyclo-ligase [Psychromicrobium silvestre]|uniref:5-formyltetrahydrofolate cyclo-ligase n=1 Tax=Psychromicrobium silvestre TaxID=1645614 RepID=A0A7Y9LTA0_9MICC|nr:5-formyltetrahydrofolate cyclo-ligase [Psychromicrobium silvestre]
MPLEKSGVAGYLPSGSEPAVLKLLTVLSQNGHPIYLPVCQADFRLAWTRWFPGVELRRSSYAPVLEPVGELHDVQLMNSIGLLLIPALAVDARGVRMGQGGGYYDRFLATLSELDEAPVLAAVVYSTEVLAAGAVASDTWDQAVDYALTPEFFQDLRC